MRFGVLGPLGVWTADGEPVVVPEAKVRALLVALLAHDGPVSADRLVDDLWGAEPPGNPVNTLQTKVSQLRRAVGRELVAYRSAGYALVVDPEAVDAHRFRRLVAQARASAAPGARRALLDDALALWRGPAFADFADEPFVQAARQRLAEEHLDALEESAAARLELGEHTALAGELGELVATNPLRERLRALHVRALYRAGRQSEALAGLAELRERLADELGIDPSPELVELQQAILTQDTTLAAPAAVPHNLPVPVTDLVGRDGESAEVLALLGSSRLVTLTGPGGVGKTRLAIESARGAVFRDGVRLVELAGVEPGEDVTCSLEHAVLAALEVQEAALSSADPIAEALRGKEILLVLDNCEHVINSAASMAARLLRLLPGLRFLATSREALGIAGETLLPVPPLAVPETGAELRDVRASAAVQLFAARAAATSPGFDVTADNSASVAAICRRLDGIPLALELAATRIRVLGARTLESRLDDRFALLNSGHRDAPERQRTLHAVIDWSWQLLPTAERIVLRRLAIHRDGCTLTAAEAVCSGDGVRPAEVLDLLSRLVDRSLVVVAESRTGEPRYRLLDTVAAYCLQQLREAGEHEAVRQRRNEHYADLAERAETQLRGPEQRRWLELLDAEAANLRAVLDDAAPDVALRLVTALSWYWFLRGRLTEARQSLAAALVAAEADDQAEKRPAPLNGTSGDRDATQPQETAQREITPERDESRRGSAAAWYAAIALLTGEQVEDVEAWRGITDRAERARARWFLAHAQYTVADLGAAEATVNELVEEFAALQDRWGLAAVLSDHSTHLMTRGDLAAALEAAERSAELFRAIGDRWGLAQASYALGMLAGVVGDYTSAERHHTEALRGAESIGLWAEVAYQTSWLGRVALLRHDYPRARELHGRAMRLAAERGFTPAEMYAETGLALGARREGRFGEAEQHLHRVLEWHRRVEFEPGNTLILAELGFLAELRGDLGAAREHHLSAYRIARRIADPRSIALTLEGLAGADAASAPERAACLLGAAEAARASAGTPLPEAERGDLDRITAEVRKRLTETEFDLAVAQGAEHFPTDLDALTATAR
ncbi:AfsR/SARP family transcriptional regulator [Saccharopolyspora indica]|uniref:BTAD domain-containing putative transcriptional regulator n=1 Tax=Saccharopolyspora indica TaxID=1229659 RepID=UPI0022EB14E9|nr:BTAD domain-containing putative transcriptional regulator [Saccharopolyspora indica]MDA3647601.1 BTAD domain-containing putative transcriptional regulator [Saccharopolyspora indica]